MKQVFGKLSRDVLIIYEHKQHWQVSKYQFAKDCAF